MDMNVKKKLDWTPRRYDKDDVACYCSEGCGHDCTQEAFINATLYAAQLAKRLGDGWVPVVDENLGWHWHAKKGDVAVYRHGHRKYWATVMVAGQQYQFTAGTPQRAVEMLARVMSDHAGLLKATVLALL